MSNILYRLICLTNLHMGSGDTNYGVIDLEVERDPVLGEPTMNASGVKGALKDFCKKGGATAANVMYVFGSDPGSGGSGTTQGSYNFFSGDLLARPVRVSEGTGSYLLATTPELIKTLLRKLHAFGHCKQFAEGDIPALPANGTAVSPAQVTSVEGIPVTSGACQKLTDLLGSDRWVLMSEQQLQDIDLPVLAHNVLDNGISKNLWYEQVVPHESVFMLVIAGPDGDTRLDQMLPNGSVVQFGAGATTGNGFVLMQEV